MIELFREYWNINIEYKTEDGRYGNIRLNVEVASECEKSLIEKISDSIGAEIYPVGLMDDEKGLLLATDSCEFYLLVEGFLYFLGHTFEETLATIMYRKSIKQLNY